MDSHRVLVTGGSGFIGSRLVESIGGEVAVTVFDVDPSADPPGNGGLIEGDVRDREAIDEAVASVDVVVHLAAMVSVPTSVARPFECHEINATGTVRVLEAARRHDTSVVVASSAAVYGHPERTPISESDPTTPTSPYGASKLSADHYVRLYHDRYGLDTVSLRYFNVYGPKGSGTEGGGVIDAFVDRARSGEQLPVHGDGEQTRDFVHVDDVVRATLLAAEMDGDGRAYNVGTGRSVSVATLAAMIREIAGSDSKIVSVEPRDGDVRHSCADISRASESLGYEPRVELEDGLRELLGKRDSPTDATALRRE